MMLEGVTTFVTGASRGIGREIATTLAAEGADVALAARSDGIYETRDAIDDDESTLAVETDVTDEASVEAAIEATIDRFGGWTASSTTPVSPVPPRPSRTSTSPRGTTRWR